MKRIIIVFAACSVSFGYGMEPEEPNQKLDHKNKSVARLRERVRDKKKLSHPDLDLRETQPALLVAGVVQNLKQEQNATDPDSVRRVVPLRMSNPCLFEPSRRPSSASARKRKEEKAKKLAAIQQRSVVDPDAKDVLLFMVGGMVANDRVSAPELSRPQSALPSILERSNETHVSYQPMRIRSVSSPAIFTVRK